MCISTFSKKDYEICPYIKKTIISEELVNKKWKRICDFLIDSIDMQYYIELKLDSYYICHASKYYKKYHNLSSTLVYGYNFDKKEFNIAGYYYHSKYSFETISFSEITKAYKIKNLQNIKGFNSDFNINIIKLKKDFNYKFDKNLFIKRIKEYLDSYNFRSDLCYPKDQSNIEYCEYGVKSYSFLVALLELRTKKTYLKHILNNYYQKSETIDVINFRSLYEHKKIILSILIYIKKNNYFDISDYLVEVYSDIVQKCNNILKYVINYNFTKDEALIRIGMDDLYFIASKERYVLTKIIKSVEKNNNKTIFYQYHADEIINNNS
jgi:hypothetical protein